MPDEQDIRQRGKVLSHLLGEAFPGKFTVTLVFNRDEKGRPGADGKVEVVANPQSELEARLTMSLVAMLATQ